MLLIIGWRGDPEIKDEPQHALPGKILNKQLEIMNIPAYELDKNSNYKELISLSIKTLNKINSPVAILVKDNSFEKYRDFHQIESSGLFTRKTAIEKIIKKANKSDIFLTTTGKASRELYQIRIDRKEIPRDFLTVGSMGHVSSIALGLSHGLKENQNIICIDGDGSCLMHMGSLAILGTSKIKNLKYFLINNGVHDSVGGQDTVGFKVDFCQIAKGCRFEFIKRRNGSSHD